jgi:DNA repair exonuclease SbcCD ATPase subunit
MEKTMQQEAEKIELELPEEESSIEVVEEAVEEQVAESAQKKDELDQVSESVQKRIDKLTYKMREAERQRDEAVSYASNINKDNSRLKERLKTSDTSLFKEYDSRINSDIERAKINLREAQDSGDGAAIADATERLSRASAEAENLKRLSAQQKIKQEKEVEQKNEEYRPTLQPQQQSAPPDPKAEAWASKNSWFGEDQAMTFAAFGIHKELVDQGVDPASDSYYNEVDKRIKDYFPQKFSNEQAAPVQQVAASSRGAGGKRASRKVKLTPSQVAIARKLNVPLEEYAKHIEGV